MGLIGALDIFGTFAMKLSDEEREELHRNYWFYKQLENRPRLSQQLKEIKKVRNHLEKANKAWRAH